MMELPNTCLCYTQIDFWPSIDYTKLAFMSYFVIYFMVL